MGGVGRCDAPNTKNVKWKMQIRNLEHDLAHERRASQNREGRLQV
jgi:hypothetical protein